MASAADEYFFVNESLSQMKTMFRLKPFPESISVTFVTFTAKGSDPSDQVRVMCTLYYKRTRD